MDNKLVISDHVQAWEMVLGQLNSLMTRREYDTWVKPVVPLGFNGDQEKFRLAVSNPSNQQFIESNLNSRIAKLLSGLYQRDLKVEVLVANRFVDESKRAPDSSWQQSQHTELSSTKNTSKKSYQLAEEGSDALDDLPATSKRKVMLQRAYGDERASIIQPDKAMYVTKYFLEKWLPLLGHSALIVIMMTRKVCYWNPYTGEKRDILETEMGDLAQQACISVRTLKTVLKNELVKRYFIRYTVRRVMTPNGIRTAGIRLQVRMDDPLTPQDQENLGQYENGTWFSPEFEDESEDYDL